MERDVCVWHAVRELTVYQHLDPYGLVKAWEVEGEPCVEKKLRVERRQGWVKAAHLPPARPRPGGRAGGWRRRRRGARCWAQLPSPTPGALAHPSVF